MDRARLVYAVWMSIKRFLFWLQLGHRLTPQDLHEVADLVSSNNAESAYAFDMLTYW